MINPGEFFFALLFACLLTFGCTSAVVEKYVSDTYKTRLIDCNAAEYRIDPKTGEKSFVIFAEEKNEVQKEQAK